MIVFALFESSGLTVTMSPGATALASILLLLRYLVVSVIGKLFFDPSKVCITIVFASIEITVPATSEPAVEEIVIP